MLEQDVIEEVNELGAAKLKKTQHVFILSWI